MMVRETIAVIPARGGSKRLPRKNILAFMGRPLLSHTISAARACGCFDRIVVSTEDEEIAAVARDAGVDVPFLRDKFADDTAPVSLATLRAVAQASAHFNEDYRLVVQLMPNCPLRGEAEIRFAIDRFAESGAESQISAFKFGWMNPWWAVKLDGQGHPSPIFDIPVATRSQDLPPLYCPSGAIWVARRAALSDAQTFFTPGHVFLEFPWETMVDIDNADDLAFAEAVWLKRHKGGNAAGADINTGVLL
jgi:N-acylneuraminate cytidylyltransferase